MNKPFTVSLTLGLLMALSGILTKVMLPSNQFDEGHIQLNLETITPREFDSWKMDSSNAVILVNPDNTEFLDKIYNQVLNRTYVNSEGDHIMLSIAYGGNQSADMQVHRPEICYTTAGFDIGNLNKTFINTSFGNIPVMRVVAKQGARNEPITYWIRVGDSLTRGWVEQHLTAMAYSLTGTIPDGLLFRISTISNDEQNAFRIQEKFLSDILEAMRSEDRYWLIGQNFQPTNKAKNNINK